VRRHARERRRCFRFRAAERQLAESRLTATAAPQSREDDLVQGSGVDGGTSEQPRAECASANLGTDCTNGDLETQTVAEEAQAAGSFTGNRYGAWASIFEEGMPLRKQDGATSLEISGSGVDDPTRRGSSGELEGNLSRRVMRSGPNKLERPCNVTLGARRCGWSVEKPGEFKRSMVDMVTCAACEPAAKVLTGNRYGAWASIFEEGMPLRKQDVATSLEIFGSGVDDPTRRGSSGKLEGKLWRRVMRSGSELERSWMRLEVERPCNGTLGARRCGCSVEKPGDVKRSTVYEVTCAACEPAAKATQTRSRWNVENGRECGKDLLPTSAEKLSTGGACGELSERDVDQVGQVGHPVENREVVENRDQAARRLQSWVRGRCYMTSIELGWRGPRARRLGSLEAHVRYLQCVVRSTMALRPGCWRRGGLRATGSR
jgi:hypothetical protein